jgi:hypothetical protein
MKKLLISLACVALCSLAHADTHTTSFYRFQCDPAFGSDGTPIHAPVQAFWRTISFDNDGAELSDSVKLGAQWDAVTDAATTVTIPGLNGTTITLTYGQVLTAVMAIANQEKNGAQ